MFKRPGNPHKLFGMSLSLLECLDLDSTTTYLRFGNTSKHFRYSF